MLSTLSLPSFADWMFLPKGTLTSEDGYWLTEQDARDTLAMVRTYKAQAKAWESAYEELRAEVTTSNEQFRSRLQELEDSINAERRANKRNLFLYAVGAFALGFIAGR